MKLPYEIAIGLRYTRAKRRNEYISFISLASMLVIALGVMALIVVMSVMNGFQQELRSRILSVAAHIQITGEWQRPLENWQFVMQEVAKQPGVVAAAPYIDAQAMLSSDGQVRGVAIRGIDPTLENQVTDFSQHMRRGAIADLQPQHFQIILGDSLARFLNVGVGDKVSLIAPQSAVTVIGMLPRIKNFEVVGIFHVDHHEYDNSLGLVNVQDAQTLFQLPGQVSGIRLKLNDIFAAPSIVKSIAAAGKFNGSITDWTQANANFFRALKIEKTVMFVILSLIVLVAAFNLVSTLVMAVTDKEADIAILRTLGASPKSIMQIFMIQGIVVSGIGIVLGTVCGITLALNIGTVVPFIERLLGNQFLASDIYFLSELPSKLESSDVIAVVVLSLILSLLATLYPSWRGARLNPVEALRYE